MITVEHIRVTADGSVHDDTGHAFGHLATVRVDHDGWGASHVTRSAVLRALRRNGYRLRRGAAISLVCGYGRNRTV